MCKPVIDRIADAKIRFRERAGRLPNSLYLGADERRELDGWLRRGGHSWRSQARKEVLGLPIYSVDALSHLAVSL